MLRALYSGVAGLKSHQTRMDVIGNNIANVNTYGFKSSRVSFKDVFYQSLSGSSNAGQTTGGLNGQQIGYGSMVNSIDVLHTRSGFTATGRPMDCYIDGEGYFIARDGQGNERYTRVGILGFDGDGNLVDANGQFICGYPIKRDPVSGEVLYETVTPASGKTNIGGMQIDLGVGNGDDLNGYKINVTNTGATGATVDKTNKVINVNLPVGATKQQLQNALQALGTTSLTGVDFSQVKVTGPLTDTAPVGVGTIAGGVDSDSSIPQLDKTAGPQPIKKPGTLVDTNGDGTYDKELDDVIELKGIQISGDGVISGTDNNGNVIPIGQICLANIPNPEALSLDGNSYFSAVNNTGGITYQPAGNSVCGSLASNGLEASNVDLSNEFSDMIVTQRGFQANSRVITVGDEMLQELVNLKR